MHNYETSLFNGLKVITSHGALEATDEPMRKHVTGPWQKPSYHARIQKKWNKRWGFIHKPCYYLANGVVICHPALYSNLIAAIKPREATNRSIYPY